MAEIYRDITYTSKPADLQLDESGLPIIPDHPSYLVAADNHQLGNTGGSLLNPDTWGDRADSAFKFSVSVLARAVASTYNSVVTIGEVTGIADKSDRADTGEWLRGMDDDLGKYYEKNKQSVDIVGDVVGMFAPGLAGMKLFNYAQKGIVMATEGKAGLNMARAFGVLPTKQAEYAALAAADIRNSSNTYKLINANLAKSLAAGYAQNALEFAAFDIAASTTMRNSPLFDEHDMGDIAYNALLGGGVIGAGIMGSVTAIKTIHEFRAAGKAADKATHAYRTVQTEVAEATPASEALAVHMNNIERLPKVVEGEELATIKAKNVAQVHDQELNNARKASHKLAGNDAELGNTFFDVLSRGTAEGITNEIAGVIKTGRAGFKYAEEKADTTAVSYFKLFGADAGKVHEVPTTLTIADKSKNAAEVLAKVSVYKHSQAQDWSLVKAAGDADAVEARYIKALETPFDVEVKVGAADIPFLEAAYNELTKGTVATITLKGGTVLDQPSLYRHITEVKTSEAARLQAENAVAIGEAQLSVADVAKMVNVSPRYLEQGASSVDNSFEDVFAIQSAMKKHTDKMIEQKGWKSDKGLVKTYLQPQYAKMVYDTERAELITGHEISGIVVLKEEQAIYRQSAINVSTVYLAADAPKFAERLPGFLMAGANRESVGGGLVSSMNGDYKSLASFVQQIGAQTLKLIQKKSDDIATTFADSGHALLNDPKASTEFWKVAQQLRQTPEKYELVANRAGNNSALVNIKQLDYEQALKETAATGKDITKVAKPVYEDAKAPIEIALESEGLNKFAHTWDGYHKNYRTNVTNLRNSQGMTTQSDLARVFYVPPVDGRQYPHFAFVVDDSITSTGHITTIHAQDAATLEALASKVPTDQGFRVIYKSQSEEWHRAMKDYDYELGINSNYIDSALKRSGVSAPTFPVTDAPKLWNDLMGWRKNQEAGLVRDMLEHRYSPEFAELRRQGAAYSLAETSRKEYMGGILKAKTANPYEDYIKAALGVSKEGATPIWSAINRLASTSVDTAVAKLGAVMSTAKSSADLENINTVLKSIGVNTFQDAATYALANHTAPKPALERFVRGANALLSFTMLRSDPMNAVNNGLGHMVLYGTELPRLIKETLQSGPAGKATIEELLHLKVPGTAGIVQSPTKLVAKVTGDWWSKVIGGEDGGALYKWAKEQGYLPSYTDQFRMMSENLTIKGGEKGADLDGMLNRAFAAGKLVAEKMEIVSLNKGVEEMNRFRSAVTAKYITDAAVATGVLPAELAPSIINTFVNRVEGVHLAAQRPLLFKGALGQSLGLFQTYQFNMLQQMFRYIGDGSSRSTATLLGLQGSIYGLNGLPAFNAMNTYIVGNAAGNTQHRDIIQTTYDAAGKEAGNWLLYGLSSNMLLHPDAKVNMYSRGDINPRQVTVIPTNLGDVPIVGASAKLFSSIYETGSKISKGADMWGSFLQGVEHSGISRPLSGIAQALEATNNPGNKVFSTDNRGNIGMENDFVTAMTAARVLGAKPLDEAVAVDAFHRTRVYDLARRKQMNLLGEGIKATVIGGNVPSPEQINSFTAEYMKSGGRQQQFAQFYTKQVMNANKSKVNAMIHNSNNPNNEYMQSIMGGYQLSDFVNNPPVQEPGTEEE